MTVAPRCLRPLAGDQTDAARGGVKQQRGAGPDLIGLPQQVAHRHALQHHGGAGLVVDAVGQLDQPVRRHHPFVRVTAERARVGAAVTDLEIGYAGADSHDFAGAFAAGQNGSGIL